MEKISTYFDLLGFLKFTFIFISTSFYISYILKHIHDDLFLLYNFYLLIDFIYYNDIKKNLLMIIF